MRITDVSFRSFSSASSFSMNHDVVYVNDLFVDSSEARKFDFSFFFLSLLLYRHPGSLCNNFLPVFTSIVLTLATIV